MSNEYEAHRMEDIELINAVLNGSGKEFERLIKRYQSPVFRVVIGLVHSKEDAEEVTQDVFLKAYRSLSSFNGKAAFSSWLYRIAINTSLNFLRKRRNKVFWSELAGIFQFSSKERSVEEKMIQKSDDEIVRHLLDTLPRNQRLAFVLVKYEGVSQKEAAAVMKTSEGAVEQLVLRAKSNLRKNLGQAVGFETIHVSKKEMKGDEKRTRY